MYFYEIEVYDPLLGNEMIIMGHDDCFNNHQLNIIVQEAFDECIEKYCNKPLLDKGEEACKIDRYEKTQYKQLELWELKDRLNQTRAIVSVYDLPDDIAEEIIDYSLKLIEEKMK